MSAISMHETNRSDIKKRANVDSYSSLLLNVEPEQVS